MQTIWISSAASAINLFSLSLVKWGNADVITNCLLVLNKTCPVCRPLSAIFQRAIAHYVISPTRPVVYPWCCSLLAKVVSLGASPPEPPRNSSTWTRPVLTIPSQQMHTWTKIKKVNQIWNMEFVQVATCWLSVNMSVTWADCITARHKSSTTWGAEWSSCNVLS